MNEASYPDKITSVFMQRENALEQTGKNSITNKVDSIPTL